MVFNNECYVLVQNENGITAPKIKYSTLLKLNVKHVIIVHIQEFLFYKRMWIKKYFK